MKPSIQKFPQFIVSASLDFFLIGQHVMRAHEGQANSKREEYVWIRPPSGLGTSPRGRSRDPAFWGPYLLLL